MRATRAAVDDEFGIDIDGHERLNSVNAAEMATWFPTANQVGASI